MHVFNICSNTSLQDKTTVQDTVQTCLAEAKNFFAMDAT